MSPCTPGDRVRAISDFRWQLLFAQEPGRNSTRRPRRSPRHLRQQLVAGWLAGKQAADAEPPQDVGHFDVTMAGATPASTPPTDIAESHPGRIPRLRVPSGCSRS